MFSLIKRLFGKDKKESPRALMPEARYVVRLEGDEIINERPDGIIERVSLSSLKAVIIETNDSGPWGADVWWILLGDNETGCVYPGGATGETDIVKVVGNLPGFDNDTFFEAMSSTSNRRFLCWQTDS